MFRDVPECSEIFHVLSFIDDQNQFRHGKIFLLAAKSISPRQNHFHLRQNTFLRWLQRDINKSKIIFCKFEFEFEFEFELLEFEFVPRIFAFFKMASDSAAMD